MLPIRPPTPPFAVRSQSFSRRIPRGPGPVAGSSAFETVMETATPLETAWFSFPRNCPWLVCSVHVPSALFGSVGPSVILSRPTSRPTCAQGTTRNLAPKALCRDAKMRSTHQDTSTPTPLAWQSMAFFPSLFEVRKARCRWTCGESLSVRASWGKICVRASGSSAIHTHSLCMCSTFASRILQ